MTAKEARERTNTARSELIGRELDKVHKMISKAVYEGQYNVFFKESLNPENIKALQELGYKVESRYTADITCSFLGTIVSW